MCGGANPGRGGANPGRGGALPALEHAQSGEYAPQVRLACGSLAQPPPLAALQSGEQSRLLGGPRRSSGGDTKNTRCHCIHPPEGRRPGPSVSGSLSDLGAAPGQCCLGCACVGAWLGAQGGRGGCWGGVEKPGVWGNRGSWGAGWSRGTGDAEAARG